MSSAEMAALSLIEGLREERDRLLPLAKMGHWALMLHRDDFGDVDGGSIQDKAIELGLLAEVEVTERCGEDCACAEWDDFPQTCLRLTPLAQLEE